VFTRKIGLLEISSSPQKTSKRTNVTGLGVPIRLEHGSKEALYHLVAPDQWGTLCGHDLGQPLEPDQNSHIFRSQSSVQRRLLRLSVSAVKDVGPSGVLETPQYWYRNLANVWRCSVVEVLATVQVSLQQTLADVPLHPIQGRRPNHVFWCR